MADLPLEIDIQDKQIEIVSECQQVPSDGTPGGIQGGILCTGFLDVEKVIKKIEPPDVTGAREVRVWFLEKKLPFQLLVLRLPNQVVPPVTTRCLFFHPRPKGFFKRNFFRRGTLTDTERNCALACVANRSLFIRNLLTAVLPTVPPTPGCPLIPADICATFPSPDANCRTRFVAILKPWHVGGIINAACPLTTTVPKVIRTLTGQFFAVLLNTCICATGVPKPQKCEDGMRQVAIGGVRLDCTVNLNRLLEPTRSNAIAIFRTATPTVQDVINEAERILNVFCTTDAVDANAATSAEVLAAMAQEPPTTIIECPC